MPQRDLREQHWVIEEDKIYTLIDSKAFQVERPLFFPSFKRLSYGQGPNKNIRELNFFKLIHVCTCKFEIKTL